MESTSAHPLLRPHQVIDDRYELVRLIGEGGMGVVWEARHIQLESPVAIKFAVERRASEKAFVERFRREACAMARLRSPNIVQVFDTGLYQELPYLVMELLEGESLRERLERQNVLPLCVASLLAEQVGRALEQIHRKGMVHRDVTPANLFLLATNEEFPSLRIKLLDFGVAKDLTREPKITISGALVGSPAYMSPEQARAERVDARSDLWSFGAVLYRAVTGEDAFEARSLTEVLFRICAGEVPTVTAKNPSLPLELDAFFERAFARNPSFRFASGTEMAESFRAIIAASPGFRCSDEVVEVPVPDTSGFLRQRPQGATTLTIPSVRDFPRAPTARLRLGGTALVSLGVGLYLGKLVSPSGSDMGAVATFTRSASLKDMAPPAATSAPLAIPAAASTPLTIPAAASAPLASFAKTIVSISANSSPKSSSGRNAPPSRITKAVPVAPRPPTTEPVQRESRGVDPVFGLPITSGT